MADAGCTLTSAAMVFSYLGASTDPGVLNSCCGDYGCRTAGCGLVFGCASSNCSGGHAVFEQAHAFSWPLLCGKLSQNRPPIVEVSNGGHWVVVYKSNGYDLDSGSDYRINDPYDGSSYKALSYYDSYTRVIEYRGQ